MKILVYSDLQADDGNERCHSDPGKMLQLYRVEKFFKVMADLAESRKLDAVCDLGDTMDNQSDLSIPALECTLNGLDRLIEKLAHPEFNLKLIGNHDFFRKDSSINNGRVFSKRFAVVVSGIERFVLGESELVAVSYPRDYSPETLQAVEAAANLTGANPRRKSICLVHAEIVGAAMASETVKRGFPLSLFKNFSLTLAGHIHRAQSMGNNIHYVGSPFQQNFGESSEAKRVAIVDTDFCTVEWVRMDGFPQYKKVTMSQFENYPENEDRIKVILHDEAEAEKFFKHKRSSLAQADYSQLQAVENKPDAPAVFDRDEAIAQWAAQHKLDGWDEKDLIEYGSLLMKTS